MIARWAADAVVLLHLLFIAFVVAGALLLLKDRRWVYAHLPAVAWGAYAELTATQCPLTPVENWLREAAGAQGFSGGFVEHYLIPIVYPAGLAPEHQWLLGLGAIVLNVGLYALVIHRAWRDQSA